MMPRPSRLTGSPQSSASGLRQWLDEAARLALDRPHRLSDPFGLPGDPALANYLGKVALVDRGKVQALDQNAKAATGQGRPW
jgi:hypothetical protein